MFRKSREDKRHRPSRSEYQSLSSGGPSSTPGRSSEPQEYCLSRHCVSPNFPTYTSVTFRFHKDGKDKSELPRLFAFPVLHACDGNAVGVLRTAAPVWEKMDEVKRGKKVYPIVTSTDCGDTHKNDSAGTYMEMWKSHFGRASHAAISRDLGDIISFAIDVRLKYPSTQAKIYLSVLSASYPQFCASDLEHLQREQQSRDLDLASKSSHRPSLNLRCLYTRYEIDDLAAQWYMSTILEALRPYGKNDDLWVPALRSQTDLVEAKTQKERALESLELEVAEAAKAADAAARASEQALTSSKNSSENKHKAKASKSASGGSNGKKKHK